MDIVVDNNKDGAGSLLQNQEISEQLNVTLQK